MLSPFLNGKQIIAISDECVQLLTMSSLSCLTNKSLPISPNWKKKQNYTCLKKHKHRTVTILF